MEQKEIKVNKAVLMMIKVRSILLKLADDYGSGVSKKLADLVTELGITDSENEIRSVFDFLERHRWVEYTHPSRNHYEQFHYAITDSGVEIAEKIHSEKRWNEALDVCVSINNCSVGTMFYVISKFEEKDIISAMEVAEITSSR